MEVEEYKKTMCEECGGKNSCLDLDGDLLDEQVIECMRVNKYGE